MIILDDSQLPDRPSGLEIVRHLGRRQITHVIHDIDGTHSLIRDWMPVMSLTLHYAMTSGLPDDFDSEDTRQRLVTEVGAAALPETDRFCVESAGMSALTQMEWGLRRGIEEGAIPLPGGRLSADEGAANSEIVRRMWDGRERFSDLDQPARLTEYIRGRAPRLFRLYEAILNGASRDRNVERARKDPPAWRVPGSLEFLQHLRAGGAINYFVTGSVVADTQPPMGMMEEITALGFEVGPGKLVEAVRGSSWEHKVPKEEAMRELLEPLGVGGESALVVGDGRSEVAAGVAMGAAVMSRLPVQAKRQRELHRSLSTNYIVADYTSPALRLLLRAEE
jgi:phosphoglycolate phosphatase-like HAD superfamily hydrolase